MHTQINSAFRPCGSNNPFDPSVDSTSEAAKTPINQVKNDQQGSPCETRLPRGTELSKRRTTFMRRNHPSKFTPVKSFREAGTTDKTVREAKEYNQNLVKQSTASLLEKIKKNNEATKNKCISELSKKIDQLDAPGKQCLAKLVTRCIRYLNLPENAKLHDHGLPLMFFSEMVKKGQDNLWKEALPGVYDNLVTILSASRALTFDRELENVQALDMQRAYICNAIELPDRIQIQGKVKKENNTDHLLKCFKNTEIVELCKAWLKDVSTVTMELVEALGKPLKGESTNIPDRMAPELIAAYKNLSSRLLEGLSEDEQVLLSDLQQLADASEKAKGEISLFVTAVNRILLGVLKRTIDQGYNNSDNFSKEEVQEVFEVQSGNMLSNFTDLFRSGDNQLLDSVLYLKEQWKETLEQFGLNTDFVDISILNLILTPEYIDYMSQVDYEDELSEIRHDQDLSEGEREEALRFCKSSSEEVKGDVQKLKAILAGAHDFSLENQLGFESIREHAAATTANFTFWLHFLPDVNLPGHASAGKVQEGGQEGGQEDVIKQLAMTKEMLKQKDVEIKEILKQKADDIDELIFDFSLRQNNLEVKIKEQENEIKRLKNAAQESTATRRKEVPGVHTMKDQCGFTYSDQKIIDILSGVDENSRRPRNGSTGSTPSFINFQRPKMLANLASKFKSNPSLFCEFLNNVDLDRILVFKQVCDYLNESDTGLNYYYVSEALSNLSVEINPEHIGCLKKAISDLTHNKEQIYNFIVEALLRSRSEFYLKDTWETVNKL